MSRPTGKKKAVWIKPSTHSKIKKIADKRGQKLEACADELLVKAISIETASA
jgi:hypothetical protein